MSALISSYGNVNLTKAKQWIRTLGGSGRVFLEKDDECGIAFMRLANPKRRNALDGAMMVEFSECVDELEKWEKGKSVIIYGSDGFFCSGMDLNVVKNIIDDGQKAKDMGALLGDSLLRLKRLPLISVALVEGKALGGGAELTTGCDFRVVTPTSEIGFVHAKMGITFGFGAGARLVQLLGYSKALQIMVSAKNIAAEEALKIGLADLVLTDTTESGLTQVKEWLNGRVKPT